MRWQQRGCEIIAFDIRQEFLRAWIILPFLEGVATSSTIRIQFDIFKNILARGGRLITWLHN